jgi:phospholipid/cholesterol/gamma-HCH transport system substrate-binding protein
MPSAQRVVWAKFRVSAVILVALAILGTIAYLLTGGTLLESTVTLYLYLADATGLSSGTPVEVNGIGVGKVQSVILSGSTNPDRVVKVTMTVERQRLSNITTDSTAQIASETAIGDKVVAISSGTSAGHIPPNGEIPMKPPSELLKTLESNRDSVVSPIGQFQKQVDAIDAVIGDIEQGKNRVGEFVIGDQIYRSLLKRIVEIERAAKALSDTTGAVGHELYTDQLFRQIHDPLAKLDRSLAELQAGQGSLGKFLHDPAQYAQLRGSLGNLRNSIADFKKGPFVSSEQSYSAWNRQVAGLIRSVDEFNSTPMMATSATYDNLNGAARQIQQTLKEFRENPRKFLRLKVF